MITHESSLEQFSEQFDYVLEYYLSHQYNKDQYDHIVLGGLGGSGIGALIARSWFFDKLSLPLEVINDYHLPAYVNEKTFVVLNSYSGNTEETIQLFEQALSTGATILIICAGGKLNALAREHNCKLFTIPEGYQPRMTIGFGLSYMLLILGELSGDNLEESIRSVRDDFITQHQKQVDSAQRIFDFFKHNLKQKFVIIADRYFSKVALRFSQQINENAKLEAFVHELPEANHNVLESYVDKMPSNFIMLYTEENPRVTARFDFLISHLEMENNKVLPLVIPEFNIYSLFDVIYRLDWVSVYMANELGAPLMRVPNIDNLKDFLNDVEIIDEED